MKSYLVETQDDSAPVKYKVLLKKKAYPNQDILDYYQSNSLETLRVFGFGKYQYMPYSKVIENDPTYV